MRMKHGEMRGVTYEREKEIKKGDLEGILLTSPNGNLGTIDICTHAWYLLIWHEEPNRLGNPLAESSGLPILRSMYALHCLRIHVSLLGHILTYLLPTVHIVNLLTRYSYLITYKHNWHYTRFFSLKEINEVRIFHCDTKIWL